MDKIINHFVGVEAKDKVKKTFREFSKLHHPDKGGDAEKFREVMKEYLFIQSEIDRLVFPLVNEEAYKATYKNYYDDGGDIEEAEAWYTNTYGKDAKGGAESGDMVNDIYAQYKNGIPNEALIQILERYYIIVDNEFRGMWNHLDHHETTKVNKDIRAEKVYVRLLNYCSANGLGIKEEYIILIATYYDKSEAWIQARMNSLLKRLKTINIIED